MIRSVFVVVVLALATVFAPGAARADVWPVFRSETKMYAVEFPSKPSIVRSSMRVSPELVIYSEQMDLKTNAGPSAIAATTQAHYTLRMDQSFGPPLSRRHSIPSQIEDTMKQYIDSYTAKGGKVTKFEDYPRDGYVGKSLWIDVPVEGKTQTVRINLFMLDRTKIVQIAISPKEISEHYTVSQFFHSTRLYKGETVNKGEIEKDWTVHKLDPDGRFTVRLPPAAPPILAVAPKVETYKTHTHVDALFYDAPRNEKLLFKAHLYDYGTTRIDEGVFDLFLRKYHYPDPDKALLVPLQHEDFKGVSAVIPIRFSAQEPWMEEKKVKAYFVNNYFGHSYVLVLEISGKKKTLEEDPFAFLLMNTLVVNGKPVKEILASGGGGAVVPTGFNPKY